MSRALAVQGSLALFFALTGATLLARPAWFGARGEAARYPARIAGMMLMALGLFLGGFAGVFVLAGGGL